MSGFCQSWATIANNTNTRYLCLQKTEVDKVCRRVKRVKTISNIAKNSNRKHKLTPCAREYMP